VSSNGFRNPEDNPRRLALLGDLFEICRRVRARELVLPGGFLTAENESGVDSLVGEVGRRGAQADVVVFGGVDLPDNASVKHSDRKGARGLPYFGFATGLDGRTLGVWRQVSADGTGATGLDKDQVPGPERVVTANGHTVGVLICGELFNPRLRENLAAAAPGLILDLGHESMKRVIRSVCRLAADADCPVGHTHHLSGWYGRQLHWAAPGGIGESDHVDESQVVERDGLWAAWTIRRIG
jgi:hypothetical protein